MSIVYSAKYKTVTCHPTKFSVETIELQLDKLAEEGWSIIEFGMNNDICVWTLVKYFPKPSTKETTRKPPSF